MIYDVGEPVTLTGLFYSDEAQTTPADPTTVVLTIRDPSGTILTATPVDYLGVGTYAYTWTPAVRGQHEIHWVGTGAVAAIEQYGVNVRGGFPATTDLVDVQTVRSFMRMPKDENDQDPVLEGLIATASAHLIESYSQEFAPAGAAPATRRFTYNGGAFISLAPYNAQAGTVTAVTLTLDGGVTPVTLVSGTDWVEMPAQNRWGVTNYLRLAGAAPVRDRLVRTVSVTAKWGYPVVPEVVQRAACITVMHWHRTQVGLRPSGFSEPDEGTLDERVAIPQMARWLLRPFERLEFA